MIRILIRDYYFAFMSPERFSRNASAGQRLEHCWAGGRLGSEGGLESGEVSELGED